MRLMILLLCFSILNTGCHSDSKKTDKKQQVMSLRNMSELATAEYVVTKIIKASDDKTWYKAGERKILMTCKASMVAGIDLSDLSENDVTIDGENITVILPKAKLIYINIKPEDIKTAYEDVSLFRTKFSSDEKNDLAIQAENQLKESIQSLGILTTAETNASLFIDNFLKNLGYKNINIHFSTARKSLQ
jgi:hypothetical protein